MLPRAFKGRSAPARLVCTLPYYYLCQVQSIGGNGYGAQDSCVNTPHTVLALL